MANTVWVRRMPAWNVEGHPRRVYDACDITHWNMVLPSLDEVLPIGLAFDDGNGDARGGGQLMHCRTPSDSCDRQRCCQSCWRSTIAMVMPEVVVS